MITKPKKLTPASICAQRAWEKIPLGVKKELRKTLPDKDKDGVPNGFDCRPKNKRKQESFLPSDDAYVKSLKSVKLGKKIGDGCNSQVYEVAGNSDFVVKVPHYLAGIPHFEDVDINDLSISERKRYMKNTRSEILTEVKTCNKHAFNTKPVFIPTKAVRVTVEGVTTFGLLRPKVTPIRDTTKVVSESTKHRMTDSKLWKLYTDLVSLTRQGYAFHDGLQLGLDKAGRALVYDLGDTLWYPPSSNIPYNTNNSKWRHFLEYLGKTESEMRKYPQITRS